MNKFILTLLSLAVLTSCQDNDIIHEDDTSTGIVSVSYNIPVDSAISYLYDFIDDTESSRTSTKRAIASITPIKYNSTISRASNEILDCENLVYIANFEQGQGYAILAADSRIEEKVIAITDNGSLSDATVYSSMELANAERVILDDYPKTGNGFFTTPETGDELFINPNTVSLYDETIQDTLVGNFSLDDIGAIDEDGYSVSENQDIVQTPEMLASVLCVSYAVDEIQNFNRLQFLQTIIDDTSSGDTSMRTETINSGWTIKKIVSPMLNQFSNWWQQSPFNDLYPEKRKYLFFGKKRKAPAGCFPLAISKLLTYFEYPDIYTYNGYTVNWKELKKSYSSNIGKNSAAHLLKGISSGCDSWYFYAGTFTFPHKATSYMRFIGLNNAHSHGYNFDLVTNMLDNGKPLIIYSVPGINVFKSHSWNIDGYKIKERTITTNTYNGSTLTRSTSKTETTNMVHCDFGWKGKCNGYYVSGVFKLNDSRIEHDPGTDYGETTNYNNLIKVITYDR
jgi:hypothetical protein